MRRIELFFTTRPTDELYYKADAWRRDPTTNVARDTAFITGSFSLTELADFLLEEKDPDQTHD